MTTFRSGLSALVFATLAGSTTFAAEVKPLKVFAVTGEFAGKEVDYAAERKADTTVTIFVNAEQWTRPAARYLKVLDTQINKGIPNAEKAVVVAVWLTNDVAKAKEYLPKAQQSLDFSKTALTVFEGQVAGPDGWNADIAAQLTVVVVRNGEEKARFSYKSTNDADVPEVVKALEMK
jgi:hypothetical protein